MTTKYTPGPWLCQTPEEDGSINIIGDNLGGLVGAAHCWPTEVETGGSDRVRANARLIAAAPELAELARMVVEASDLAGFSGPLGRTARDILARID